MKINNPYKHKIDDSILRILKDIGQENNKNLLNHLKIDIPLFLSGKSCSLGLCDLCKYNGNYVCRPSVCIDGKMDILKRYNIIQ